MCLEPTKHWYGSFLFNSRSSKKISKLGRVPWFLGSDMNGRWSLSMLSYSTISSTGNLEFSRWAWHWPTCMCVSCLHTLTIRVIAPNYYIYRMICTLCMIVGRIWKQNLSLLAVVRNVILSSRVVELSNSWDKIYMSSTEEHRNLCIAYTLKTNFVTCALQYSNCVR
jgi:hypothetical protein